MSTESTAKKTPATATKAAPAASRKKKKAEGRKKRVAKLKTDKEFAKKFHDSKSKRAIDKKAAFRKKKSKRK